jgi:hypothetical protein
MPDSKSDTKEDQPAAGRPLGLLRGKIWVAEDFDETPDYLIALIEGVEKSLP